MAMDFSDCVVDGEGIGGLVDCCCVGVRGLDVVS
jgi:hypothetical protein